MLMVIYRCMNAECYTAFAIEEDNERDFPYCPLCANRETIATGELMDGEIKPDNREL